MELYCPIFLSIFLLAKAMMIQIQIWDVPSKVEKLIVRSKKMPALQYTEVMVEGLLYVKMNTRKRHDLQFLLGIFRHADRLHNSLHRGAFGKLG